MVSVQITCLVCGAKLRVPQMASPVMKCPKCGNAVSVPTADQSRVLSVMNKLDEARSRPMEVEPIAATALPPPPPLSVLERSPSPLASISLARVLVILGCLTVAVGVFLPALQLTNARHLPDTTLSFWQLGFLGDSLSMEGSVVLLCAVLGILFTLLGSRTPVIIFACLIPAIILLTGIRTSYHSYHGQGCFGWTILVLGCILMLIGVGLQAPPSVRRPSDG
jgi:hypothetical protein